MDWNTFLLTLAPALNALFYAAAGYLAVCTLVILGGLALVAVLAVFGR